MFFFFVRSLNSNLWKWIPILKRLDSIYALHETNVSRSSLNLPALGIDVYVLLTGFSFLDFFLFFKFYFNRLKKKKKTKQFYCFPFNNCVRPNALTYHQSTHYTAINLINHQNFFFFYFLSYFLCFFRYFFFFFLLQW